MGLFKNNIINKGKLDENNSSITNLDISNSYTFTGQGTSTLGVNGLQWVLKTDQNATVYIEESLDNINWDISYSFDYIESKGGQGETVQATASYWRIRVVLTGIIATTYFRLQSILCPLAVPLPSALTQRGRLKTETEIVNRESLRSWISPVNQILNTNRVRLVGKNFDGTIKDPNFWTETVANGGSIVQSGGSITLKTNTSPNGSAKYVSNTKARFVAGTSHVFISRTTQSGLAQYHVHRIGPFDDDNGFFLQAKDFLFSIGIRRNGIDTLINDGEFNGDWGKKFPQAGGTVYFSHIIEWTPTYVAWYIFGRLLHKVEGDQLINTNTLPITIETENTNGSTTDHEFTILETAILRQGELITEGKYYHISGAAATHNLKYGAGRLQRVIFNNTSGSSFTIYDGIDITGNVIGIITTKSYGFWEYNVPFSTGLTIVTVGDDLDATVVYE